MTVSTTTLQVSKYIDERNGEPIFAVEILDPDDTWDQLYFSRDLADAQKYAERSASERNVPLLPDSNFPGRSTLS